MVNIEDTVIRLRTVIRLIARRADSLRQKNWPTRSEQSVLAWIEDHGPMTPRALADAHQVRPQTMQQTLDSLERRRWIRRANHPTDRRQVLISLTAPGRKALFKGRDLRQAWLVGHLRTLSRSEQKTLGDALAILEHFLLNETPTK